MAKVTFPCVIWEPRYEVTETLRNGRVITADDELYCTRVEAEAVLARMRGNGSENLSIQKYEVVFLTRCVVCGETPIGEEYIVPGWCWVLEELADAPGWLATPEQLVFCPAHRPDGEGA